MTLKSFLSAKNAFFGLGAYFCTGISTIGLFPLRLHVLYLSFYTAINSNLSLNSGTELWLGQIQ